MLLGISSDNFSDILSAFVSCGPFVYTHTLVAWCMQPALRIESHVLTSSLLHFYEDTMGNWNLYTALSLWLIQLSSTLANWRLIVFFSFLGKHIVIRNINIYQNYFKGPHNCCCSLSLRHCADSVVNRPENAIDIQGNFLMFSLEKDELTKSVSLLAMVPIMFFSLLSILLFCIPKKPPTTASSHSGNFWLCSVGPL